MTKTQKIILTVFICFVFLAVALAFVACKMLFDTWNIADGAEYIKQIEIDDSDFCVLKEGHYCGEGGADCGHWIGLIYYEGDMSPEEALFKAGFEDIDETYASEYDNNGYPTKYEKTYTKDLDSAVIENVSSLLDGYLLEYHIIGTC